LHKVMMLRNTTANLGRRRFLEGVGTDVGQVDLPGDDHDRNAVELRVGDAGDNVGEPRAARRHADADFAGRPSVSLRREPPALLVSREDDADLVAVTSERLVKRNAETAGVGENRLDAAINKGLNDDVRAVCHRLSAVGRRVGRVLFVGSHVAILSILLIVLLVKTVFAFERRPVGRRARFP